MAGDRHRSTSPLAPPSHLVLCTNYSLAFKKKILLKVWLLWVFITARGLSRCSDRGPLFVAVYGLLTVVASLAVARRL